ncbi:MAG: hypothetical protein ACRDQF_09410, partial [Thermocrispum sp.]
MTIAPLHRRCGRLGVVRFADVDRRVECIGQHRGHVGGIAAALRVLDQPLELRSVSLRVQQVDERAYGHSCRLGESRAGHVVDVVDDVVQEVPREGFHGE